MILASVHPPRKNTHNMLKPIILSIVKTVVVAASFAGACTAFDIPFIQAFISVMCVQFIFFFIWNTVSLNLENARMDHEETERIKAYSHQGVDADCAHCSKPNFIPVRFDEKNEFECQHCEKINSVYINITTAQVTDILDRASLSVSAYIADKLESGVKVEEEKD